MNARSLLQSMIRDREGYGMDETPGDIQDREDLRSLDALLADAVGLVNGDTRNADKRDAWVERAAKLGYGPEDKQAKATHAPWCNASYGNTCNCGKDKP